MPMQTFALNAARIGKFKGHITKHAVAREVLSRQGRQVMMPKNASDTYVARKWLPYKATSTDANTINRFFVDGTGDRGNAIVQENQIAEGITPTPDSITPVDTTVVIQQYGCLYGFTDKTAYLYEDDIPEEMGKQIGERVTLVNELVVWGALKAGTNTFFGGTGTTIATTNGKINLSLIRKIVMNLLSNHAMMINQALKGSPDYESYPISAGYCVYGHTDLESDVRDLPNFHPVEAYASQKPLPFEIGSCERFRFITSPEFVAIQDAGAAVGSSGLFSTTGTSIDVYPFLVCAQDAWSQIAVRGLNAMKPTYLPPSTISKSDPLGQRGYAGTVWWKAVLLENNGWLAVGHVGRTSL